jgi:hypothetical protein
MAFSCLFRNVRTALERAERGERRGVRAIVTPTFRRRIGGCVGKIQRAPFQVHASYALMPKFSGNVGFYPDDFVWIERKQFHTAFQETDGVGSITWNPT